MKPNKYLLNERGHQMYSRQLKIAMGCKPGPKGGVDWPREGIKPTMLQGVLIWVTPRGHGSKHRAFVACPDCGWVVPAGRIHQHTSKKGHA
jgi:hypothetical protein